MNQGQSYIDEPSLLDVWKALALGLGLVVYRMRWPFITALVGVFLLSSLLQQVALVSAPHGEIVKGVAVLGTLVPGVLALVGVLAYQIARIDSSTAA